MIETTATDLARRLHEFLAKVEHGETVIIRKHGRTVARMVPDTGFMTGKEAVALFRSYRATQLDKQAADAIEANIRAMDAQTEQRSAKPC